jgi:saccharopine dehydrogenase-like NADP-dependent oxidoreductase
MRVIVFGGAGDMGSRAVEDLAGTADVSHVTIADSNTVAAERVKERLGNAAAQVEVRHVDALNRGSVIDALRGHDVAASALGPFYKFEAPLIEAAIEARVDYVSIADDWSAVRDALDLNDQAQRAGVTVITGLGASPGMTNLLACYLSRGMESVKGIDVSVYQPWSAGGGEAVLRHLLYIVSGNVAAFRVGKASMAPACSVTHDVEMPVFGVRRLWNLGHGEPVSLPRHFKGLESCNFWMGLGTFASLFMALARRGWFAGDRAADRVLRIFAPLERFLSGDKPALSTIRVDVWGTKDGKQCHAMACGAGTMREGTGLALAAGALLVGRRQLTVTKPGVYAPESCVDPGVFIETMRAKGVAGFFDAGMTIPLK